MTVDARGVLSWGLWGAGGGVVIMAEVNVTLSLSPEPVTLILEADELSVSLEADEITVEIDYE
jgi:hypothetical protein